jgi:hypothetical protein
MVSHNVSEGAKPRNFSSLHWAKGLAAWKPVALHAIMASVPATCRGRRPWRVIRGFTTELGRTISFPKEASNEPKRQRRKYGGMVVGLTRSRGVNIQQFLTETVVLTASGGLLGVLFGLLCGPLFRGFRSGVTMFSPDLLPPIVHTLEPRIAAWSVVL